MANEKKQTFSLSDLGELVKSRDNDPRTGEEGTESEEMDSCDTRLPDGSWSSDREDLGVQSGDTGDSSSETPHQIEKETIIMDHQPLKLDGVSLAVKKAEGLVEKFFEVNRGKTKNLRPTDAFLKNSIGAFADLVSFCVKNPKPPVLDVLLTLYKREYANLLSDTCALQGSAKLHPDTRRVVEQIHVIFSLLASGEASRKTINLDVLRETTKSDDLINYLSAKF